ncbi:MAG: hypothetical protein J0I20_35835 [Chloroflexi bacterium]|nr:hypothetical protein [Chloroflexota bacterium]OJW06033.1 MAG: hypothetical protein BGO39_04935 [Chloroflexi bacterium 54-19]
MLEALNWYALILLLGVITLPVSFLAFRHLPDRGFSFSKPLGLLLVSLLAWWLANLKWFDFTALTGWLSVGLLALFSGGLLAVISGLRRDFKEWFRQRANLKTVLASELLFLAGYAAVLNLRSFILDTNSWTERFFNFAFINSIATTTTLPPPDPWFGGQPINYYYGSHFLLGMLCKLSGLGADFGYTLGMGLVFALGAQACFGLVGNLVALTGRKGGPVIRTGLLGAVFMLVAGNLTLVRSVLQNGFLEWGSKFWPTVLDIPGLTGFIFDKDAAGKPAMLLTEFPVNSYLKGDLQANQMDVIFILLALGFGLQFLVFPRRWALVGKPFSWQALGAVLLGGTLLGALNFINGVDFVPFFGFTVLLLGLGELRGAGRWPGKVGRWLLQVAALAAATRLVYLFYTTSYGNMVKAKPVENLEQVPVIGWLSQYIALSLTNHTNLSEYLWQFGLFLFPIITFYGLLVGRLWQEERQPGVRPLPRHIRAWTRIAGLEFAFIGGFGLVLAVGDVREHDFSLRTVVFPLLGLAGAGATLWPGLWEKLRQRPRLTLEAMAGLLLFAIGVVLHFELLGILAALVYLSGRFAGRYLEKSGWRLNAEFFAVLAVAIAAALTLCSEVVYVRDVMDSRFNMVLKFWQEAWLLYSLSAAFLTWRVVAWRWEVIRPARVTVGRPLPLLTRLRLRLSGFGFTLLRLGGFQPPLVEEGDGSTGWVAFSVSENTRPPATSLGRGGPANRVIPLSGAKVVARARSRVAGWARRFWLGGLAVLLIIALMVPVLYSRQVTLNFSTRYGLNSEDWYARTLPADYAATTFLKNYVGQDPARRGIVLENNGLFYSYNGRVSVYTGLPTVVGWANHELQWRGNLDELDIWKPWVDMGKIYETTDQAEAEALLKKYNVKYVFVGQIENGNKPYYSNIGDYAHYSPEALAKFSKFMKTIYADPLYNVYIYAFE